MFQSILNFKELLRGAKKFYLFSQILRRKIKSRGATRS